jgi:hypothetical protein
MNNFGVIVVTVIPAIWIEIAQHQKVVHGLEHVYDRK